MLLRAFVPGLVPRGTHEWTRFISPVEFAATLSQVSRPFDSQMRIAFAAGLRYDILSESWALEPDLSVNYIALATKD